MQKEQELITTKTLQVSPSSDKLFRSKIGYKSQQLPRVKQFPIGKQTNENIPQSNEPFYSDTRTPKLGNKRTHSKNQQRTNSLSSYNNQIQQILEKIDDPQLTEAKTKPDALYQIKSQNLFMQGPMSMKVRELGISTSSLKRSNIFPPKSLAQSDENAEPGDSKQQMVSPSKRNGSRVNPNEKSQQFFIRNNFSQDSPSRSTRSIVAGVGEANRNKYLFTSPKQSVDSIYRKTEGQKNNNQSLQFKSNGKDNNEMQQQLNNHLRNLSYIQEGYLQDQYSISKQTDVKIQLGSEKDIQIPGKYKNFNIDSLREGIKSQLGQNRKNIYTSYDTRFHQIRNLNNDNQKLKSQIIDIQNELEDMDEFKIAMEHQQRAENVHEMRFDLLKAQISRQQKHIRRLTGLLQGSRKATKEVLSLCSFFTDMLMRHNNEVQSDNYASVQKQKLGYNKGQLSNRENNVNNDNNNVGNTAVATAYPDNNAQLPSNEDSIIIQLDQKLMNLSLKNLLNNFASIEERENFVNNFYTAYSKIVEQERSNKEFSSMFDIKEQKKLASLPESLHGSLTNLDRSTVNSQKLQDAINQVYAIGNGTDYARKDPNRKSSIQNKVKYRYPVKEFLEKYKDYVPINTIFTSFPCQQKDSMNNMINVLQCILKKCEKGFKQVRTFQLYKGNPFIYTDKKNRVDLPDTLLNYKSDFDTFLRYRDQMISINLSHEQLMKTESDLSSLLHNIVTFYAQMLLDNKNNPNYEISKLVNQTRKSIEQMICLGVLLSKDTGSNNARYLVVAQNINSELSLNSLKNSYNASSYDLKDEQNTQKYMNQSNIEQEQSHNNIKSPIIQGSPDDSQIINQMSQDKGEIGGNQIRRTKMLQKKAEQMKLQQKLLDELKDYEQLRTLKIEKDVDCTTDFFDRHQICENIFDDLYRNLKSGGEMKDSINLALKLGTIIHKMKCSFEMKNNILLVKEMQIDYLKNQIYVYKQDIIQCNSFITETQQAINNFFSPINLKLNEILSLFTNVIDGSKQSDPKTRKHFILTFKKNLKEILELIKRIEDKNFPIDQLNIKQLREQFQLKVDLACMKHETLKKNIQSN